MLKESFVLSNGILLPKIGFGTYQIPDATCGNAVLSALKFGYTHIDTAIFYGNHKSIGSAISSTPRSSLFLTSKIPPNLQGYDSATQATLQTLADLKTDYLDLMLIHWPGVNKPGLSKDSEEIVNIRHETWRALEDLYSQGKIKAIGVSNFLQLHLEKLFLACRVRPMVNQFEYHPWCHDDQLVRFCNENGIVVEAYSSLARAKPELWSNPDLVNIGAKYSVSIGQVLLRWGLQKGVVVIPKSTHEERIHINSQLDFVIDEADMRTLDGLHCNHRTCWDPNSIKL